MTAQSAWDVASAAAARAAVELRRLTRPEDPEIVTGLIDAVWGGQSLPRELIRAFQHAGSVLIGAEGSTGMVGFVLGFAALRPGLHVHSHMLAVLPECRSRGVGYALKLAQRAECLDHGIEEVRWTFDPMVARNAHFNLVKLGTEAVGFFPGFYGEMTDRINRGDRTDRFEVVWRLRSERVRRAVAGTTAEPSLGAAVLESGGPEGRPEPVPTGTAPRPGATVAIPMDHHALRAADPALGRRWREVAGVAFEACFSAGLAARWFTPDFRYVFDVPGGGET